jgi:hypothetical protein
MGRKAQAAKASLVAAFVAAGGAAATAKAHTGAQAGKVPARSAASNPGGINWGDALVRFLKLDGFPSYLKVENFAQYYKLLSLDELSAFYNKDREAIDGVLALYQKGGTAEGSLLQGILIGLEQYYKENNSEPLLNFLKEKQALAAYDKWSGFFRALKADAENAFAFFYKETGIPDLPAVQLPGDGGGELG